MTRSLSDNERIEQAHQDDWYARAVRERFFDREGFRRLVAWNLDAFRRAVPLTSRSRLLSIGCGLGDYELILAREVASVTALDLSDVATKEATRRAQERGLTNVTFSSASYRECHFEDGAFDVVYAFGVLHHLSADERRELFGLVSRWLAPGGRLYVRDPNADGWLRRALEGWFRRRSSMHSPNEGSLSPAVLRGELEGSGFTVERVDEVDVIAGPLPWLVRSSSSGLWTAVFAFDRLCLSLPVVRNLSSQFAMTATCR
ncbi:MAG: class I SAM-dependent methyltransferase [Vicinamibacterales bacterium]